MKHTDKPELTPDKIKATAYRLLAQEGTAGLGLRPIARELGVSAPSIYRYFASLDDLITALILDAFNALADTLQAAADEPQPTITHRLMAVMHAYRGWANAHPTQFELIYGTPLPNYEAPTELTVPASSRTMVVIVTLLEAMLQNGECVPPPAYHVPPEQAAYFTEMMQGFRLMMRETFELPSPQAMFLAVQGWSLLHGLIMLEITGHIEPVVGDMDAYFSHTMRLMFQQFGAERAVDSS